MLKEIVEKLSKDQIDTIHEYSKTRDSLGEKVKLNAYIKALADCNAITEEERKEIANYYKKSLSMYEMCLLVNGNIQDEEE